MNKNVVLDICLALQKEQIDDARIIFNNVIKDADDEVVLNLMGDSLLMACRKRQLDLFYEWLLLGNARLLKIISQNNYQERCGNLLQHLVFAACDRRIDRSLPILTVLIKTWLQSASDNSLVLNGYWREWLNLIARMARRGWRFETKWLMGILSCWLCRQKDLKKWQNILQQLSLHFTVHAKWDGFTNACTAFVEMQYLYLFLVNRASCKYLSEDVKKAYLILVLRNIRDLIANVSRSTMKEDMDIFRQWYQFLWQLAGDSERNKRRWRLLLQLSIFYWQNTRPKTSRKQAKFVQDLLNPDMVTSKYSKLLSEIC